MKRRNVIQGAFAVVLAWLGLAPRLQAEGLPTLHEAIQQALEPGRAQWPIRIDQVCRGCREAHLIFLAGMPTGSRVLLCPTCCNYQYFVFGTLEGRKIGGDFVVRRVSGTIV